MSARSQKSSDPRVVVTVLPDKQALSLNAPRLMTLAEIGGMIRATAARETKGDLTLLKLARFGEQRSEKNSLRHDANVVAVGGIEGDYDGQQMPMHAAAERLRARGLAALLYTSASHRPEAPKWRVLCPLASELIGNEAVLRDCRRHWTGVLNAVLGGVLTRESFTLSQSYYFGGVAGKPAPEIEIVEGGCLDELAEPPSPQFPDTSSGGEADWDATTDEELREAFERGEARYSAMQKLSARWAARGMPPDDIEQALLGLLENSSGGPFNFEGIDLRTRCRSLAESAVRKYGETRAEPVLTEEGLSLGVQEAIESAPKSAIILPNDNLPITWAAERAFRLMGARRELFTRGGMIVEVRRDGGIEAIKPAALCSRLEAAGRRVLHIIKDPKRKETYHLLPKECSKETADKLAASTAAAEHLPPLSVISDCALLAEVDGKLTVLGRGYHPVAGGILVRSKKQPPEVAPETAARELQALFDDFVFATPADKARAVAGMIGPALRFSGLVQGHALMTAVEAKESQSGKGYLLKLHRAPYGAEAYDVVQKAGGVGSLDETLAQAIFEGKQFIAFENMRGRLESTFLEHSLTPREHVSVRVPYKGSVRVDISRVVFQLTSNGVEGTTDLSHRILLARLEKRPRGFAFKAYPEGDLLQHVAANAEHYLGCIFAVVGAWHSAGKPQLPTSHSCRPWVGVLDWIVQKVFALRPLLEGHDAAVHRIADPTLSWLRAVAQEVMKRGQSGRALAVSAMVEIGQEIGRPPPGVRPDAETDIAARAMGRRLNAVFADAPGGRLTLDDISIMRLESLDEEGRPTRRYEFGGGEGEL